MSAANQPFVGNPIPPAKYFTASQTYDKWVKLTVSDIHALKREREFEGQNIYFHLNHPIQYIQFVAPVVGIEDLSSNIVLVTLDDGSGACIDVRFVTKDPSKIEAGCSNTDIKNLSVSKSLGTFDILIDGQLIDVATVVKIKGTISTYRKVKQIDLKRIELVKDTNAEAKHWRGVAQLRKDVLSKPWVLNTSERAAVDRAEIDEGKVAREEERKRKAASRAHNERRALREEKIKQHEMRVEQRRRIAEVKLNAGALPNSDLVWQNY